MLHFQEPITTANPDRINERRARLARLGVNVKPTPKRAGIERKTYIVEPVLQRPKTSRYYADAAYEAAWAVEMCGVDEIFGATNINTILRIVAKHFNMPVNDIVSARRTANVVMPRHIAMYLAKTMTPRSFPEVGRRMGGRDHTTVLHAFKKIERLIQERPSLAEEVNAIKHAIRMAAYV